VRALTWPHHAVWRAFIFPCCHDLTVPALGFYWHRNEPTASHPPAWCGRPGFEPPSTKGLTRGSAADAVETSTADASAHLASGSLRLPGVVHIDRTPPEGAEGRSAASPYLHQLAPKNTYGGSGSTAKSLEGPLPPGEDQGLLAVPADCGFSDEAASRRGELPRDGRTDDNDNDNTANTDDKKDTPTPPPPPPPTFEQTGLSGAVLSGIRAVGFKTPTPVQARAIPAILRGQNVMVEALGGSGKTGAFGFPALDKVEFERLPTDAHVQVLVLVPTNTLAEQHAEALTRWAKASRPGVRVMRLMGTDLPKPAKEQLMDSRRRPHVVVATMGRLKSFLERGTLRADRLKMLVIDEVDEMIW
jgi:hypothetical protein